MTDQPTIPTPAPYRRPDAPTQDANMADTELMLRQKLAPETTTPVGSQQWNQMAPPPLPTGESVPFEGIQSPGGPGGSTGPGEVTTPGAKAGAKTRTRGNGGGGSCGGGGGGGGGGGVRTTRRRKTSSTPIKDESDNPSSEEFTMEGVKTKSGRKVHRPAHFNPAQKQPSRRRGPYRRIHDSRICKICQRGHSPQSNMIVFCDGCNTPFHQLCHDPPIDDLVIAVAEAEWFCAACAKKREEKPLSTGLSGQGLTDDEKRTYLASLPLGCLVELVFFAEKMYPDLPLYDPQTKKIVAAIKSASVAAVAKDINDENVVGVNGNGDVVAGAESEEVLQGGVPNWEDMVVRAIAAISDEMGSQAKAIFEWLGNNYPAIEGRDIRSEAQGSLQSALRKNRLVREGHSYKINPEYVSKSTPQQSDSIPIIAPGSGIKLPPETEDIDGLLVDDDLVAFSHKFHETSLSSGVGGNGVDDVMGGIVGGINGDVSTTGIEDAEGDLDAEGVEDVVM